MRNARGTIAVFAGLALLFAAAALDFRLPGGRDGNGGPLCAAHGVPAATCDKCDPQQARGGTALVREREPREGECPNTLVRITLGGDGARLVPPEDLHTVKADSVAEVLRANAETRFPPERYARVSPRLPGVIREVKVRLGESVEAGAPLATLDSPGFGQLKADFLQARGALAYRRQLFDSEAGLLERKATSEREYLDAKTALEQAQLAARQAEQKLSWIGLSPAQIEAIAQAQDASPTLEIPAPFAGQILAAAAVIGETAEPGSPVFTLADNARMWVVIDVYEGEYTRIEPGQRVFFRVEGLPEARFPGRVVAIGGEVDDRTRTVPVFAEIKNTGGLLRAHMFGSAEVHVKSAEPKILVPKAAVQNDGDCNLVFVSPIPNVYQARRVELGTIYESGFEVRGGLTEGDRVATTGSFLLKTEILRGQIGAG